MIKVPPRLINHAMIKIYYELVLVRSLVQLAIRIQPTWLKGK